MNQHLLVKMPERRTVQFRVAHLGKAHNTRFAHGASLSLAKAGPMSGAIALGLTCDRRLELDGPALRDFPCAAE